MSVKKLMAAALAFAVTACAYLPLYAAGDVAAALAGAADSRLGKYIVTDAEYNAYVDWMEANGLGHETVTNSARAWFSHAIWASNLVERVFVDDDLKIVSLDVSDGEFTTFSTFSKESLALAQSGRWCAFSAYAFGSVAISLIAVALGYLIANH